jgi:hypothetical protein
MPEKSDNAPPSVEYNHMMMMVQGVHDATRNMFFFHK